MTKTGDILTATSSSDWRILLTVLVSSACSNVAQPDDLALAVDEPAGSSTTVHPAPTTDSPSESAPQTIVDEPADPLTAGEIEIASWDEGVIAQVDTKPQEPRERTEFVEHVEDYLALTFIS